MSAFPQLTTGASATFPIRKRRMSRTVVNESADGTRIALVDTAAAQVFWNLQFSCLTDAERDQLTSLFEEVEGRLHDFLFLDPTDNLLEWSETLSNSVWQRTSLLELTEGVSDPFGTTRASQLNNTGGAALRVEQTINVPGGYHYAFSVYARSGSAVPITMIREATDASASQVLTTGAAWKRYLLSGALPSSAEALTFAVEIGAGQLIDLFGLQVEPQGVASAYKVTTSRSGVYPAARFADDALTVITDAPNQHRCDVKVFARG
jgi:hypothetical protein